MQGIIFQRLINGRYTVINMLGLHNKLNTARPDLSN